MASASFAEEFDFRDVKLGMTIEEINNLESVKLNYMPKVRSGNGLGGIGCKPAKLSRSKSQNEYQYDLTLQEKDEQQFLGGLVKRSYMNAPGLFCENDGAKLKTENINFTNMTMKFWESKLVEFQIHYDVKSENDLSFHNSLKTKFLKTIPNQMHTKEMTNTQEAYLFDELTNEKKKTGKRGLIIELKAKPRDGGLLNYFKSATPYSGALYMYDLNAKRKLQKFGEQVFGKPLNEKPTRSQKVEPEIEENVIKRNLDKKLSELDG